MDHTLHQRLAVTELTEDSLTGALIYPDDYDLGSVSHLYGSGHGAQVVVDVGEFLGIGAKPVALSVSQLDFMRGIGGDVYAITTLTKDEVQALPEHHD